MRWGGGGGGGGRRKEKKKRYNNILRIGLTTASNLQIIQLHLFTYMYLEKHLKLFQEVHMRSQRNSLGVLFLEAHAYDINILGKIAFVGPLVVRYPVLKYNIFFVKKHETIIQ